MEQIILKALLRHLETGHVIGVNQHGFTHGKSCLTSLVTFMMKLPNQWINEEQLTSSMWTCDKVLHDIWSARWREIDLMDRAVGAQGIGWMVTLRELYTILQCPGGDG